MHFVPFHSPGGGRGSDLLQKKEEGGGAHPPTMSGPFNSPNYPQPGSLILCGSIH